jgi:pilus assembly protein CpaB
MKPARILLLLVALLAGGLAAFLATRGGAPAPEQQAAEVQVEPRTQVLVATGTIGTGQRITPADVEWIDWPQSALRPEYITIETNPEAPTELTDAVVRFEFFPGEPIREQKLVRTDQGYLSAVLAQGKRGVSLPVEAESSAGGFIVPNDRVDVVLTRSTASGDMSEVILSNVRVLAIGTRLGEVGAPAGQEEGQANPQAQVFGESTIATLELDPAQAETIINARSLGGLSLTLRSVADFNEDPSVVAQRRSTNQPVKLIRFGREANVLSGASQPGEAALAEQGPTSAPTTTVVAPSDASGEPALPPPSQIPLQ